MRIGRRTAMVAAMALGGATAAGAAPTDLPGVAMARQQAPRPAPIDLRLRSLTATAPTTTIVAADSQLRHRLIGSMIDFFPVSGTGFFVSGGGQLATRASIVRNVNSSLARLLYTPRTGGLRASSRIAPAATLGYVEGIGRSMELRLEGGALLGRMNPMTSAMPRSRGQFNAALSEGGSRSVNGVMRASFGLKF